MEKGKLPLFGVDYAPKETISFFPHPSDLPPLSLATLRGLSPEREKNWVSDQTLSRVGVSVEKGKSHLFGVDYLSQRGNPDLFKGNLPLT